MPREGVPKRKRNRTFSGDLLTRAEFASASHGSADDAAPRSDPPSGSLVKPSDSSGLKPSSSDELSGKNSRPSGEWSIPTIDYTGMDAQHPDYASQTFEKVMRQADKAGKPVMGVLMETIVETAIVQKDPSLLGKLMDHTVGKAAQKDGSGKVTELEIKITTQSGKEPFPRPALLSSALIPEPDAPFIPERPADA